MLTVHHLSKSYEIQPLFEDVSFSLNAGEKVGLIGPNGCGKTTLLRILVGEEQADEGVVSRSSQLRIGYLPQGYTPDQASTVGNFLNRIGGDVDQLENELSETASALAIHPEDEQLQAKFDHVVRQIESIETGQVAEILAGLGLAEIPASFPVNLLSGGQQTRLSLALVLLNHPQLLLLDEPTNHLDIEMLEWLERWLTASPCGALIISHDRTFLDHCVTRVLEMDTLSRSVREYSGNYSSYFEQKQVEIEKQWMAYNDQEGEVKRMKQDIKRTKDQAYTAEKRASSIRIGGGDYKIKGYKSYKQGIAKGTAKKAKAREKKLERYLDSDERVAKPQKSWVMKLEFGATPSLGRSVIQMKDLSVGYSLDQPLLRNLNLEVRSGQKVVLTGPNGSGKTTLLRSIAGKLSTLSGEIRLGTSVRLGYMTQDQSGLRPDWTVLETVQEGFPGQTEARSFLAYYLFSGDEALKPVSLLSYGQRARLALARLVVEGCNCLLLDEPVNHLDIPSRAQFEQALAQFNGTVLAVVHDRYFIDRFADEVWWVEDHSIRRS